MYSAFRELEIEGAVANQNPDGTITAWVGTQMAFLARDNIGARRSRQ